MPRRFRRGAPRVRAAAAARRPRRPVRSPRHPDSRRAAGPSAAAGPPWSTGTRPAPPPPSHLARPRWLSRNARSWRGSTSCSRCRRATRDTATSWTSSLHTIGRSARAPQPLHRRRRSQSPAGGECVRRDRRRHALRQLPRPLPGTVRRGHQGPVQRDCQRGVGEHDMEGASAPGARPGGDTRARTSSTSSGPPPPAPGAASAAAANSVRAASWAAATRWRVRRIRRHPARSWSRQASAKGSWTAAAMRVAISASSDGGGVAVPVCSRGFEVTERWCWRCPHRRPRRAADTSRARERARRPGTRRAPVP